METTNTILAKVQISELLEKITNAKTKEEALYLSSWLILKSKELKQFIERE